MDGTFGALNPFHWMSHADTNHFNISYSELFIDTFISKLKSWGLNFIHFQSQYSIRERIFNPLLCTKKNLLYICVRCKVQNTFLNCIFNMQRQNVRAESFMFDPVMQYIISCLEGPWRQEISSYTIILPETLSPVNILYLWRQDILSLGSRDLVACLQEIIHLARDQVSSHHFTLLKTR